MGYNISSPTPFYDPNSKFGQKTPLQCLTQTRTHFRFYPFLSLNLRKSMPTFFQWLYFLGDSAFLHRSPSWTSTRRNEIEPLLRFSRPDFSNSSLDQSRSRRRSAVRVIGVEVRDTARRSKKNPFRYVARASSEPSKSWRFVTWASSK